MLCRSLYEHPPTMGPGRDYSCDGLEMDVDYALHRPTLRKEMPPKRYSVLRLGYGVLVESAASLATIDGDDLPVVVRLDWMATIPLLYLSPDAGRLLTGAGCHADPAAYYRIAYYNA